MLGRESQDRTVTGGGGERVGIDRPAGNAAYPIDGRIHRSSITVDVSGDQRESRAVNVRMAGHAADEIVRMYQCRVMCPRIEVSEMVTLRTGQRVGGCAQESPERTFTRFAEPPASLCMPANECG